MKRIFIKLIVVSIIGVIIGCGKNPLAPMGNLGFVPTTSVAIRVSAPNLLFFDKVPSITANKSYRYLWNTTDYISYTIEKIEISPTGENWIEIFKGPKEITKERVSPNSSQVKINTDMMLIGVKPDEYHAIRFWIGSKIKYRGRSTNGNTYDQIIQGEADDGGQPHSEFASYGGQSNPYTMSTRNGLLDYPFTVRSDRTSYILFIESIGLLVDNVSSDPSYWSKVEDSAKFIPVIVKFFGSVTTVKP